MTLWSRRRFAGALAGLAAVFRSQSRGGQAERAHAPDRSGPAEARGYRADAVILLFGIPVYRRADVGRGYALVRESSPSGSSRTCLLFAAASKPERARGLNRCGFIQEAVVEREGRRVESSYFGVMSSSPEESIEQARSSLAQPGAVETPYTAIEGRNGQRETSSVVAHFAAPSGVFWSGRGQWMREARAHLRTHSRAHQSEWAGREAPASFLAALFAGIRQPETVAGEYVYNGRRYRLTLTKSRADEREQASFRRRGLAPDGARVSTVRGVVRNPAGRETAFRLWVDETGDTCLPLRFEMQPRSYLRLAFEFDGENAVPPDIRESFDSI